MGFKGSDSNIEVLGEMAIKTGGQVDLVDPAQVNKNFQDIFSDDTIARDVSVKLFLPCGLGLPQISIVADEWKIDQKWTDSGIQVPQKQTSMSDKGKEREEMLEKEKREIAKIFSKQLGSINSDSNLLVQFEADLYLNEHMVPFQLQLNYTRVEDGKRLLRVISRHMPISKNLLEADQSADLEVMALNAIRTVAQTAQHGNYTKARLQNYAQLQFMKRLTKASLNAEEANEVLKNYAKHTFKFEEQIYREQLGEVYNGRKWDETEEEMKFLSEKFKQSETLTIPSVLSEVGSFLSNWWSTTTTPTTATTTTTGPSIRQQRAARGDDVSNMLWNMRGAKMI